LDAAEEMQLKEELRRLDARANQAEEDNAAIEERLQQLGHANKVLNHHSDISPAGLRFTERCEPAMRRVILLFCLNRSALCTCPVSPKSMFDVASGLAGSIAYWQSWPTSHPS
jgi:hypothetical protein